MEPLIPLAIYAFGFGLALGHLNSATALNDGLLGAEGKKAVGEDGLFWLDTSDPETETIFQHLCGPTCGYTIFVMGNGSTWGATLTGGQGLSGNHRTAARARARAEKAFHQRVSKAWAAL